MEAPGRATGGLSVVILRARRRPGTGYWLLPFPACAFILFNSSCRRSARSRSLSARAHSLRARASASRALSNASRNMIRCIEPPIPAAMPPWMNKSLTRYGGKHFSRLVYPQLDIPPAADAYHTTQVIASAIAAGMNQPANISPLYPASCVVLGTSSHAGRRWVHHPERDFSAGYQHQRRISKRNAAILRGRTLRYGVSRITQFQLESQGELSSWQLPLVGSLTNTSITVPRSRPSPYRFYSGDGCSPASPCSPASAHTRPTYCKTRYAVPVTGAATNAPSMPKNIPKMAMDSISPIGWTPKSRP